MSYYNYDYQIEYTILGIVTTHKRIWTISIDGVTSATVLAILFLAWLILLAQSDHPLLWPIFFGTWLVATLIIHIPRITLIEIRPHTIHWRSYRHHITTPKEISIQTWWQYDLAPSYQEEYHKFQDFFQKRSNQIELIAEVCTEECEFQLYESIKAYSSRFPNDHPYSPAPQKSDGRPMYYVGNIDRLLKKLNRYINIEIRSIKKS